MPLRMEDENRWLLNSNLPLSMVKSLDEATNKNLVTSKTIKRISFDKDQIIDHMKNRIAGMGQEALVEGIDELKAAARSGQLLPGYLVFEEVPLSGVFLRGKPIRMYGPEGWFYDLVSRHMTQKQCDQARSFIYFHAFIYAGSYRDEHYAIEMGGEEHPSLHQGKKLQGTVTLCPLELACCKKLFGKERFFIVEAPKDEFGFTTRHMILQRALASIGVRYRYHLIIGCEAFATFIIGLFEDWHPLQLSPGVLKLKKKTFSSEKDKKEAQRRVETRYKELQASILDNWKHVKSGKLLTLAYVLENCIEPTGTSIHRWKVDPYRGAMPDGNSHILKIMSAYNDLAYAIQMRNETKVDELVNSGLDLRSWASKEKTFLSLVSSRKIQVRFTKSLHCEACKNERMRESICKLPNESTLFMVSVLLFAILFALYPYWISFYLEL